MPLLLTLVALLSLSNGQYYNRSSWYPYTTYCGDQIWGQKGENEQILFSFWSTYPATVTVNTCNTTFDSWLAFYDGYNFNTSRLIDYCDDCGRCGFQTIHRFDAMALQYYTVALRGFSGEGGNYTIRFNCEMLPTTTSTTTTQTTTTFEPPALYNCGDRIVDNLLAPYQTNYYGIMTNSPKNLSVSTCESDFDTVVSVYVWYNNTLYLYGGCDDCGSDRCGNVSITGNNEYVNFGIYPQFYWIIAVGGYSSNYGEIVLNLECTDWDIPYSTFTTSEWTSTMPMTTSTMQMGNTTEPVGDDDDDNAKLYSIKLSILMILISYFFN